MQRQIALVLLSLGVILLAVGRCDAQAPAAGPSPAKPGVFYLVPHTHWEGAVFKTREEYLEMGLVNILRALKLLKTQPNARFTLDQACYVKPFLERYPEEEATFRKLIAEGRLAIVGGMDVMPDVNMPSGESCVRQILYGKGYFRRKLGIDVTTGWQLDTFGHHAQMPQIMKLAGFQSFWFFRGVPNWDVSAELIWEGLDGSRIPAFWLQQSYAHTYGSPKTLPEFSKWMKERYDALARQSRSSDRVGLGGADVCEPEDHLPALVEQHNRQPNAALQLRLAVPADFEKAAATRTDRPVLTGELNPIFQGAYSSRIELKQAQRDLERLLTTAEKLAATGQVLGISPDSESLWRAWEPVLFNQTHDLASGVMTDHVYADTQASYGFSRRLVEESVDGGLVDLTSRIDTSGPGVPLVVWNSLGWTRHDLAEVELGFSEPGVQDVQILDSTGQEVPAQVQEIQRSADGLLRAVVRFIAQDVPAMGYRVYRAVPLQAAKNAKAAPITAAADGVVLESNRYKLRIDPKTGAMTSLFVKEGNWEALAGPANVVSREHDGGDLWELYQPLDGGSRIAMTRKQAVPQPGKTAFSHQFQGEAGTATSGPVFSEFRVAHPFGPKGTFATRVRIYSGLPRIDIQTRIVNQDKFVRYQVLFPTSIASGNSVHEIPFGWSQRPKGIEFPAQNWVDYGDEKHGVTLLNRGLSGNLVTDNTMMLSLLRSTRIVAYGFGGGYEPGMTSDTGLELDKELTFDYSLAPRVIPWQQSVSYRKGLEFNNPLLVRKATSHAGSLPNRWGLLEINHPSVVVSAVKTGEQGSTIVRVYEATGKPAASVVMRLGTQVSEAQEVNLMEDAGPKLKTTGDGLQFDLRAFEIKTFRLNLRPVSAKNEGGPRQQ